MARPSDTSSGAQPEKVLQFGTGRLLRGFVDFFIHRANESGQFEGRVICVQSTGTERANLLNDRSGRFNLWTRGVRAGREIDQIEEISSISRVIAAGEDWAQVLAAARNPGLEIIVSNASEVAIALDPSDRLDANPPKSFPGKLTAVLYERASAFNFSDDAGLVVLPCELLEDNGDQLKRIVLDLSHIWNLGSAFTDWIESASIFCNTLVDRIVTGRPSEKDLAVARNRLGYDDPMITVTEPYRLWAIEGDAAIAGRLGFSSADAGIVVTEDIEPFRERKLRLLNGGHTLTVPLGILKGNETVLDNMEHPEIGPFIDQLMRNEIGPTVPVEPETIAPFIDEVLDRWRNPFLDHKLRDIAWQSTSKMRSRVVPTIVRFHRRFDMSPPLAARGFAAYLVLMKPEFEIEDDLARVAREAWSRTDTTSVDSIRIMVESVCARTDLWDIDLSKIPGFVDIVAQNVEDLL